MARNEDAAKVPDHLKGDSMSIGKNEKRKRTLPKKDNSVNAARLDEMIEEATIDCYNESEQTIGFFTVLEDNLAVPFITTVLGVEVTVETVDLNDADEIVAICHRGRERQRIPILDLALPSPKPEGAEWIEAYRRWILGG